jgi:uroporphyrinogen decarboxylase
MSFEKDLLGKTFGFEKTERPPVGFWFHFLKEAETGDAARNPGLAKESVRAHLAFVRDFKPDLVKIMSDGFFFYPTAGPVRELRDLEGIAPIGADSPWIRLQREVVGELAKNHPELPFFHNVFSPLTSLRFLAGKEKLLSFLKEDPGKVAAALGRMAEGLAVLSAGLIRDFKIVGIYLSVQNPDVPSFGTDFHLEFFAPSELAVLNAAVSAGGENILHVCGYGGVKNRLGDYSRYPAKALSWARNVEGVGFGEARKIFPGKVLIGGFPNDPGTVLHKGSETEVLNFLGEILAEAEPLEGVIVGADCTVPSDIGLERLEWVREALKNRAKS